VHVSAFNPVFAGSKLRSIHADDFVILYMIEALIYAFEYSSRKASETSYIKIKQKILYTY